MDRDIDITMTWRRWDDPSKVYIRRSGRRIQVAAPYNVEFIKGAKQLHGRWRMRTRIWSFLRQDETRLLSLIKHAYGPDAIAK